MSDTMLSGTYYLYLLCDMLSGEYYYFAPFMITLDSDNMTWMGLN